MAYQRLIPGQEEQIRSMRQDGKSPQDVVDFFKEKYQIELPLWKVSYITGKKTTGVASKEGPRRRAAQRKYSAKKNLGGVRSRLQVTTLKVCSTS